MYLVRYAEGKGGKMPEFLQVMLIAYMLTFHDFYFYFSFLILQSDVFVVAYVLKFCNGLVFFNITLT